MFRLHLARFDGFVVAVGLWSLVATGLAISPSSYGIVLRNLGASSDGVLLGRPQPIRSDEYALWTPMLQSAVSGGYGQVNESSIYQESQRHFYALPLRDWGLLFKAPFWLFLVLPPAYAYAGYFALLSFLFLAGYALLFQRFGRSRGEAALLALLLYFSSYSQAWWTSLGHHLALLPWLLLLLLAELPPAWRFLLTTLATGSWFLAGTFYPPLVWTLLLSGLLAVWVFCPERLRPQPAERLRQLSWLGGLAAGAAAAYLYLREPLAAALASTGHGLRNVAGGHVPWQDYLGLFFPSFPYRGSVLLAPTNFCEASSAGSYWWPLLLSFLDYRATWQKLQAAPQARLLWVRIGVLVAAFLLLTAYMLLPLPAWLGLPFLWNKFPNTRLLFPAGLLSVFLAVWLWPYLRLRLSWQRLALFLAVLVAAWWPSRILATFELLRARDFAGAARLEWFEHANADLYPAVLLGLLLPLVYLFRRRLPPERWVSPLGALLVAFLSNALTYADFNPWMSAKPIFERPETSRTVRLRELQEAHPRRWLVVGGFEYLGRILNGYGFRSVNHGFIVPETRLLREQFPALEPRAFDFLFNRYCLVQLGLYRLPANTERLRQPDFVGGDLTLMPLEAFLPATRVELLAAPPAAPLAERGKLDRFALDGNRLRFSIEGEINGTSGSTTVSVHLDRAGKIVDRWLRPRGDGFDVDAGLHLYSRLDLEIELDQEPASLAELGLCVVTRDPGFGEFRIAPPAELRSLCPQDSAVAQQPVVDLGVDRP